MPSDRAALRHDFALLAVVLIWGLNFPLMKGALAVIPPFTFNALRFTLSVATLGLLHAVEARRAGVGFWEALRREPWRLVAVGALGNVLYQFCFILGVDRTLAGSASLIMASSPIWTAVLARLFGYDRLSRAGLAALVLCLTGVVLIIEGSHHGPGGAQPWTPTAILGNLLVVAAAVFWASFTVFSRPILHAGTTPTALSFFGMLFVLPLFWATGGPPAATLDWSQVTPGLWGVVAFSGILSTGLAYTLWNGSVRHVGPARTAILGNLVPFVAVAASAVLLGEPVTLWQVAGGLLILLGVGVLRRKR